MCCSWKPRIEYEHIHFKSCLRHLSTKLFSSTWPLYIDPLSIYLLVQHQHAFLKTLTSIGATKIQKSLKFILTYNNVALRQFYNSLIVSNIMSMKKTFIFNLVDIFSLWINSWLKPKSGIFWLRFFFYILRKFSRFFVKITRSDYKL